MARVLVLIAAFLFFRAVLPRTSRSSPTAITPYMDAIDGMASTRQVSSVLDEVMPYESWLATHRSNTHRVAQCEQLPPGSTEDQEHLVSSAPHVCGDTPSPSRR